MRSNCRICDESPIPPPHDDCGNIDPTGVIADLRAQLEKVTKERDDLIDASQKHDCDYYEVEKERDRLREGLRLVKEWLDLCDKEALVTNEHKRNVDEALENMKRTDEARRSFCAWLVVNEEGGVKFRKKPVVVDAWCRSFGDPPEWVLKAVTRGIEEGWDHWQIGTLEGTMTMLPGDMLIRGVNGEVYPCRPDIFDATYERVEP